MIDVDQVMPLMVTAVPGFLPFWLRIESDEIHLADDGSRLSYLDAGEFARYIVEALVRGRSEEVSAAFEAIERLHVDGDTFVRELATTGYLEDIQNGVERAGLHLPELETYLGPESLRWWRGLIRFWSGEQRGGVKRID